MIRRIIIPRLSVGAGVSATTATEAERVRVAPQRLAKTVAANAHKMSAADAGQPAHGKGRPPFRGQTPSHRGSARQDRLRSRAQAPSAARPANPGAARQAVSDGCAAED